MKFVDLDLLNGASIINLVSNYRSGKGLFNMIIRMFDDNQDIDGFLDLFRICFGRPMSKEYFKWKYLKNPFRMDIHPIIVAEENNRLIGTRNLFFGRMMIEGTAIYTTQGADGMVHPEFRRQGINLEIRRFCQNLYRDSQYKLNIGFPNEMSIGNTIRQGSLPIYNIYRHWKIINAQEALKKIINNPILQKTGSFLPPLLWHKTRVPKLRNQDVNIKEVSDVAILEDVYNRWRKPDKIYTIRDEKYLSWRFKSHPEIDYHFLAAYVGQEVKGYFIISEREFRGMKLGTIVDYLVVDDDPIIFEQILNYSLNLLKDNNCALVNTWVFTQKWAQRFVEDYGFISSRNIFVRHWVPNAYLLTVPYDTQNFPYDLTSIEWYITLSDSDTN